MTEQTKYYKINVDKLKWEKVDTLPYLLGFIQFSEDYEYFEQVRHLLDIPVKPKTIEELLQELDDKFDNLLAKTKRKFAFYKEGAEYNFKLKSDQVNSRFEFAKTYGYFSPPLTLITTGPGITGSNYSYGTELKIGTSSVGYYLIEPNFRIHMEKRPNRIVQFFMKNLLNFRWVDGK